MKTIWELLIYSAKKNAIWKTQPYNTITYINEIHLKNIKEKYVVASCTIHVVVVITAAS
jgi:hypothetical protein